ncbi:hypothetical protein LSM04_003332 [Trypanosoma melophagium]|uniref:uncharacterized protein n=1 Tax=Trypanosoma melophagium TaxID=715481 RepID=UPI00351A73F3|nr:hypothetical protein LSM04_003332 [Trypanosoma melophagium]
MNDVIFVEPDSPFHSTEEVNYFPYFRANAVTTAASHNNGIPISIPLKQQASILTRRENPYNHIVLYEWIRNFVEYGWRNNGNALLCLKDIEELETILRDLISLDESQVRMNCITSAFIAYRQFEQRQRENHLIMMEELSKYKLQRLLHLEQRINNNDKKYQYQYKEEEKEQEGRVSLHELEEQLIEDLKQRLALAYTPAVTQARAAQKSAQDRLQAVMRVLEQQNEKLQETQNELNTICQAINELAAYTQVEMRCEDSRGTAHAALRAAHAHLSTPPLVIAAIQEKIAALQQSEGRIIMNSSHIVLADSHNNDLGVLTIALHRLQEAREECYHLQRQLDLYKEQQQQQQQGKPYASQQEEEKERGSKTVSNPLSGNNIPVALSLSSLPPNNMTAADLVEGFSMESYSYEVKQTILQEQRRFLLMMKSLKGVHTVLLRLSEEPNFELYTQKELLFFVGQSLSLHQWMTVGNNQPRRYAAVFYPLPPDRQSASSKRHLEYLLFAKEKEHNSKIEIIDLQSVITKGSGMSGNTLSDVYLSANAIRFSPDGSFMYVCLGNMHDINKTERHMALLHVVDIMREGLQLPSTHCFCYYTSITLSVGWAAAGISAWALDEMSFTSPAEEGRFRTHLRETYTTVIHLTRAEVQNFAGECVEVISRSTAGGVSGSVSLQRRLVISSRAFRSLSEHNRTILTTWYTSGNSNHNNNNNSNNRSSYNSYSNRSSGGRGCIVPDLSMMESVCECSVTSMIVSVITHGSEVPPPVHYGILSFLGIGVNE